MFYIQNSETWTLTPPRFVNVNDEIACHWHCLWCGEDCGLILTCLSVFCLVCGCQSPIFLQTRCRAEEKISLRLIDNSGSDCCCLLSASTIWENMVRRSRWKICNIWYSLLLVITIEKVETKGQFHLQIRNNSLGGFQMDFLVKPFFSPFKIQNTFIPTLWLV